MTETKMVNEGELQKRIKKLNNEFPYDFGYDMGIGTIIDEAKKDFPKIQECIYGLDHPIPHLATRIRTELSVDVEEVKKWFVKWFGSEDTENAKK